MKTTAMVPAALNTAHITSIAASGERLVMVVDIGHGCGYTADRCSFFFGR
jgi:hypothetical protein